DGVRFSLPASSVKDSGQISVEVKPTAEAPSQAASTIVSKVYDISVTNSFGNNISTLSSEAEVTIPYDEAELKNKGVSVESVIPSYFDESSGAWVAVSNYTIDKAKKVVILRINHLTRFALIAAADTTPPLSPSSVSASVISNLQGKSPGKVKISWTNPLKDIDHYKVYRSDEFGKIGKVLATVVISNSFMDESEFVDGKPYYYTVRSVDSAGNESNNTDQVSINMTGGLSRLAASNSQTFLLPPGQAISGSISRNLKAGSSGDDVKTLQRILISEDVYPEAVISGYFGRLTKNAVIKFQEKYFDEILAPGGFKQGTGYAGIASRKKLNEILGRQTSSSSVSQASKSNNSGLIVNSLTIGSAGEEVKILQNILIKEGVYADGKITGIYDSSTKEAVKLLQEKYASEILTPIGLSEGTGFLGAATRKKLNELISQ
ncbi:MAG: Fibronectin type domain protein, partial [Parcubacteria group bacterium]|nr:Fibronectin type domain protein [Parcubacteria group bacterium]